jgi:transcriptional regulator GlxA family with amidase domain
MLTIELPLHLPLGIHRQPLVARLRQVATLHARSALPAPVGPAAAAAASAAMQEVLLQVALLQADADESSGRAVRSVHVIDRLLCLIQERLDQPLSVTELAAELGMSQNHLARCFRERCGCTIQRYLIERRIEHARLLLRTTTMPIREIGAQIGMPDPQHFNKQFRRSCGLSPSRCRAEATESR